MDTWNLWMVEFQLWWETEVEDLFKGETVTRIPQIALGMWRADIQNL